MTYAQYEAAKIGDRIVIEGYIQAKQSWWDSSNTAVFYLADGDGAYFAYQVTCSEEDYNNKFTVGTKVQVIGYKTEYRGSIEISENAEIKVVGNGGKYIAKATDVTALLGTDDLIKKMNQFVAFKGMTVEASTDADGNEVAFLYKWNGTDMVLSPMNVEAFVKLPMYFAHAASDRTCKVASTYAYTEARKRLGATNDQMIIYSDEDLARWGVPAMLSHFSWVPVLRDYSEGKPMNWLVKQF